MLQVLGAVGEFERALMLERQREGIAKAKAEGKYRGRKPTVRARKFEIEEMLRSGVGPAEASKRSASLDPASTASRINSKPNDVSDAKPLS